MTYEELLRQWDNPKSDYILCHTSGSTGKPKEIHLPKKRMTESARRTAEYFQLHELSHLHSCISPEFIGGKMMLIRQKLLGCKFTWEIPTNRPLSEYKGDEIDLLSVVPSQLLYIIDNKENMPPLRNILVGGAPLSDHLRQRVIQSGLNVYESYGMTETCSHIAIRKIDESGSPFQTLAGISVEEIDCRLLIHINGWKDFLTNDSPVIFSPYEFAILGRADNIIISGGMKFNPETIEAKLEGKIGEKADFFISSEPDEKWGEAIVLITDLPENRFQEIMRTCRAVLSKYEIPKEIIHRDCILRTLNGKIIRK